jgi:hypothetical protein
MIAVDTHMFLERYKLKNVKLMYHTMKRYMGMEVWLIVGAWSVNG